MIDTRSGRVVCDTCHRRYQREAGWWTQPKGTRIVHWCPTCAHQQGITGIENDCG